jgi:molybdenum cofactor cytidylyltransferase
VNVAGQRPGGAAGRGTGSSGRIAGIVLAAGSSTRMGRNKLLLELGGETMVRRAARTAIDVGLDPVVVVTGHAHEAVAAQLHVLALTTVVNMNHGAGQHTSVAAGIAALGDDCAAAIVMLADMPFVTTAMVREVVTRYRDSGAPLVVSRYGGDVTAPPMLYDRSLFGELMHMDARCGRQVVRRHRHEAVEVDWPAESLSDLDRPADYERVRAGLEVTVRG